jgi:hypothetical protein
MPSCKKSTNEAGSEIGEPNKRSEAEVVHSDAGAHRFDAIVREKLVADRKSFLDRFDDILVDFRIGAVRDDEALSLAGAPQLRLDRQNDGIKIGPLHAHLQRRGDLRPVHADVDPIGTYDHLLDDVTNEARQFEGRRGEPAL